MKNAAATLCVSISKISRLLFRKDGFRAGGIALLFVGCLLLAILKEVLAYNVGLVPSKFYRVLGDKDVDSFGAVVAYSVGLLFFIALVIATNQFVSGHLYVAWRRLLTTNLHESYFRHNAFYKVNDLVPAQASGEKACDNADQRIAQDVERLCNELSQMIALVIISPLLIAYYLYLSYTTTGYLGPVSVFIFFGVATIINRLLMSPVMSSVYLQEKEEGDFRYYHMLIRRNCEAGAFYRAATAEERICQRRLLKLIGVQERLIFRQYWLNIFVKMCDYFASVLSYIVISFPIFYGQYGSLSAGELSALISEYAFVSIYLFSCFTSLIDLAGSAANIGGLASRIAEFVTLLERCSSAVEDSRLADQTNGEIDSLADSSYSGAVADEFVTRSADVGDAKIALVIRGLTLRTPDTSKLLISDLNLKLYSGTNLLVTGQSGVGKSSLFRLIAGLWKASLGSVSTIENFEKGSMFMVPQNPYFTSGSLADQVALPVWADDSYATAEQDRMIDLMSRFGLNELVTRFGLLQPLDDSKTWYGALSAGEAQRLCLVRALYHQPSLLLLDEATSHVEESMEEAIYEMLNNEDATIVSVGHRSSLRRYHHLELRLLKEGAWQLSPISLEGKYHNS